MKFYHGTNEEAWASIQEEGVLWGKREPITWEDGTVSQPDRCTYLSVGDALEAAQYGDIVLEVDYEPRSLKDNYSDGCWQVRVYDPIPLEQVRRIEDAEA